MKKTCVFSILLLCAGIYANVGAQNPIPEISSSVLVFGPSDYVLNGGQSRCQSIVQSALTNKQSSLMFVPTAFWVDNGYASLKSVNSQVRLTLLRKVLCGMDELGSMPKLFLSLLITLRQTQFF